MADKYHQFRIAPALLLWTALIAPAVKVAGQAAPALTTPSQSQKQDPLNRTSPQSSIIGFLDACHTKDYGRAIHYLDLNQISTADRRSEGPQLAQELEQVLNRDAQFEVAALSREPDGDHKDGIPPNRDRLVSIPVEGKAVQLDLERAELRPGVPIWRVAPDSVRLIPELAAATSESPIERRLPAPLVNYKLLDTSLWRWLALGLLAIAVGSLSRLLSRLVLLGLTPLLTRLASRYSWDRLQSFLAPLQLLLCAAVFGAGMQWIDPSAVVRLYLRRILELISMIGVVWLTGRLLDFTVQQLRTKLDGTRTISRSALPLITRVLKILILTLGIVAVLGSWGYNTTTLLAGLGIGGVAVALAAQKTIENFFGSVAVVSDRPVTVGDFCKFGDSLGTVEDIGLRSTRIRTVGRTLVTVPNGQFSSMTLENFSRQDKLLFNFKLNLRRDTTPDQVRDLLHAIQQILNDPEIESGEIPVRFIGVGQYSLDIEIFVYVLTNDGNRFLKIQQELLLRILDAVKSVGTALALPTQASVEYRIDRPATQEVQPDAAAAPPYATEVPPENERPSAIVNGQSRS